MSKAKTVQKEKDTTTLITKVLLFLYMVVGLSPKVVEIEYEGFQWFYFTVLNAVGLCYLYYAKEGLNVFSFTKKVKQFFIVFASLILVSILSLYNAINVNEGIVHLLRLLNVFAGVYVLFSFIKHKPKEYFEFVCKVCVVLLAYHSFVTISYFLGNFDKPRTSSLFKSFLHYYGNINIFTASIILKLPFAIYLFLKRDDNKIWGFVSAIVVFCTMLSLFYTGSRSALLSLVIIILCLIVYSIYSYFKQKVDKKTNLINVLYFVVAPLLVLFVFLNTNKLYKNEANSITRMGFQGSNYLKIEALLNNQPELSKNDVVLPVKKEDFSTKLLRKTGRYNIWTSAFSLFKQHPILGIGYGNFKVYPKPWYFKNRLSGKGSYGIPIRVHNDFYEKFVETGIIGGTLYVLLFVIIAFVLFGLLKKGKINTISVVLLMVGIAYLVDALLNFPLERIPVQLFFILLATFVFAFSYKENQNSKKLNLDIAHLSLTALILVSVALNYMVFKVYSFNTILKNEKTFKKRGYDLSYAGLERQFFNFPKLDQDGIKISYYKANKAIKEGKFTVAMDIINQSLDDRGSAQNHLLYRLKAETFLREKKHIDSAEFYYRKGFEAFPGFKNNYLNLNNIYTAKKEIKKKEALMHSYTKQNYVDAKEWMKKVDYFNKKNGNITQGLKIIDTALAYNPKSLDLLKGKQKLLKHKKTGTYYKTKKTTGKYNEVIKLYNKRKFVEARTLLEKLLKENPNDFYAVQYIGIVEMNLKNYKKAVKYLSESIHSKIFKDGRAEYCRAYSYEKLGQIKKAKADYRKSRKLGYPLALKLAKEKYE